MYAACLLEMMRKGYSTVDYYRFSLLLISHSRSLRGEPQPRLRNSGQKGYTPPRRDGGALNERGRAAQ